MFAPPSACAVICINHPPFLTVSLPSQVLASYINPAGCGGGHGEAPAGESSSPNSNALPSVLQELLSQSCLIPAMSSYLRNDSGKPRPLSVPWLLQGQRCTACTKSPSLGFVCFCLAP